jgi:hypothetical protein
MSFAQRKVIVGNEPRISRIARIRSSKKRLKSRQICVIRAICGFVPFRWAKRDMSANIRIGIIGDYTPHFESHAATTDAIRLAGRALALAIDVEWLSTTSVSDARLAEYDGLWAAPGSPYRSMDGMLHAIRFAREHLRPMVAT